MHVNVSMHKGIFTFEFQSENDEPVQRKSEMAKMSCYLRGPDDWEMSDIHPDHIALSALLIVRPWFNRSLHLSFGVSQRFADACQEMKISVSPVDSQIVPYDSDSAEYIGLAFSGGADSTAALSVLPPSTIPFFLDRPDSGGSLYSKQAALRSVNKLSQLGYDCQIIECDLESIREPLGFPTDLSNGVPAILLAKRMKLFGIAYGTVLESLYGLGRMQYKEYSETSHYKNWWNVFSHSGLPLSYPTGGISEVGTEIICSKSSIGNLAQSCIRGTAMESCNFCWKCFRKQTVRVALKVVEEDMQKTHHLLKSKEVRNKLRQLPISHENVLIFSFARLDLGLYPKGFVQRFDNQNTLTYLAHWYSKSRVYINERIRKHTEERIISFIGVNSSEMEGQLEGWSNQERINRLNPLEFD
ncbi:DUF6395 domain-containing protein [Candidatus Poseidoniaceae archaeon]|nr:DUF6395 domain-containing protein [Candidatus Poseidoniaceae archaeon]